MSVNEEWSSDERTNCPVLDRRSQFLEVGIFILIIIPSMSISLLTALRANLTFPVAALMTIVRDLALVCLIVFFLWRNGERIESIGWRAPKIWLEILLGCLLYIPFYAVTAFADILFRKAGLTTNRPPGFMFPRNPEEILLGVILVAVVAFSEETIFRGYLIMRLRSITLSLPVAVLLSSTIFAFAHIYQGLAGVAAVWVMAMMFCGVYIWRRSLVAPIVMHFIQDFLSIVFLPLVHWFGR
jgi:membrane protease YdiL (CAAX protease family)